MFAWSDTWALPFALGLAIGSIIFLMLRQLAVRGWVIFWAFLLIGVAIFGLISSPVPNSICRLFLSLGTLSFAVGSVAVPLSWTIFQEIKEKRTGAIAKDEFYFLGMFLVIFPWLALAPLLFLFFGELFFILFPVIAPWAQLFGVLSSTFSIVFAYVCLRGHPLYRVAVISSGSIGIVFWLLPIIGGQLNPAPLEHQQISGGSVGIAFWMPIINRNLDPAIVAHQQMVPDSPFYSANDPNNFPCSKAEAQVIDFFEGALASEDARHLMECAAHSNVCIVTQDGIAAPRAAAYIPISKNPSSAGLVQIQNGKKRQICLAAFYSADSFATWMFDSWQINEKPTELQHFANTSLDSGYIPAEDLEKIMLEAYRNQSF
jgi:hypothetical protein